MKTKLRMTQVGDEWEVRVPGKRKKIKEVGEVYKCWLPVRDEHGNYVFKKEGYGVVQKRVWWVPWRRQNKGRYTGIRVDALHQYGRLISTKEQRDKKFEALWKARRKVVQAKCQKPMERTNEQKSQETGTGAA